MGQHIRQILTRQEQMSESLILSLLLAFSGGFQDAYTYLVRGHVFANAQTGNVVLMATYIMKRQWKDGVRYLVPLIAFIAGVFITENIQYYCKNAKRLHWRQGILIIEALIMMVSGFIPQSLNMLVNCMISFSCAMQVQAFRKICGDSYASTMCIGNFRSGTSALSVYLRTGKREDIEKTLHYFGVIFVFAIGAGICGILSDMIRESAIWISCFILAACILLMELDRNENGRIGR